MKIRFEDIYILLMFLMASSCAQDDSAAPDSADGKPVSVDVRLSTPRSDTPSAGEQKEEDLENINSWWVAFVGSDGVVKGIKTGVPAFAVEEQSFDIILPAGTYTAVAFANRIPQPASGGAYEMKIGEETLTFKEGVTSPVQKNDNRLLDIPAPENSMTVGTHQMPMSGMQSFTVKARPNGQKVDIEVVRQTAKIEITFTNAGHRTATINKYWIEGFKSDKVCFFPDYSTLAKAPTLPASWTAEDVARPGFVLGTDETNKKKTDRFYSLESTADSRPHGVYTLYIDVTRPADPANDLGETSDEISALITEISWVNRNDVIKIPVRLTDYVIQVDADFYPPIGGFPAIVTEVSYGNYSITFGSIGTFVIKPHVRLAEAGSPDLKVVYGDVVPKVGEMKINTPITWSGDKIFDEAPYVDDITGEIKGEIGTKPGTAYVTLEFTIPQADGTNLQFKRKIEIKRELDKSKQ